MKPKSCFTHPFIPFIIRADLLQEILPEIQSALETYPYRPVEKNLLKAGLRGIRSLLTPASIYVNNPLAAEEIPAIVDSLASGVEHNKKRKEHMRAEFDERVRRICLLVTRGHLSSDECYLAAALITAYLPYARMRGDLPMLAQKALQVLNNAPESRMGEMLTLVQRRQHEKAGLGWLVPSTSNFEW